MGEINYFQIFISIAVTAIGSIVTMFLKSIAKKLEKNTDSVDALNVQIAVMVTKSDNQKAEIKHIYKWVDGIEEKLVKLEKDQATCSASCNNKLER